MAVLQLVWFLSDDSAASLLRKTFALGAAAPVQDIASGTKDAWSASRTRCLYLHLFSHSWFWQQEVICDVRFEGANGLITLTSKNALSNLPPQKLLAAMSRLELSSVAVLWVVNVSPERRCRRGYTLMSWQMSVRRSDIRARTSLCRHMVSPPEGHERVCSVEVVPHTHSQGRSRWVQLYLRQNILESALVESMFIGHDG